jgi:PAS domain S-box-containing protein
MTGRGKPAAGQGQPAEERARKDELAAIVEHSDDAIIGMSLRGAITSWNPAAERIYGYTGAEIIGKSFRHLSPKDRAGEMTAVLVRIRAGEDLDHFETVGVRKDGTVLPVFLTVSPIRDDGEIVGASTIVRDATNQRQAFEAARSMIESSLDSLVAISPEGNITDANQATVKITGISRDKLIGTSFSDYFTEPEKANKIYQKVFAEGMAVDYPLTLRHRNGALTNVRFNASVYRDSEGHVLGVFAAARDVTKQVQDQKKIAEQQAQELERLAELERFQRLTVGRELKMIELKKEIESLRRRVEGGGGEGEPGS